MKKIVVTLTVFLASVAYAQTQLRGKVVRMVVAFAADRVIDNSKNYILHQHLLIECEDLKDFLCSNFPSYH